MSRSLLLMLCLLTGLLVFGCYKAEPTTNRGTNTATQAAASPAASTATSTTSGDKIGVTECDTFIESYEACVRDKVPQVARAQFNASLAQWRKSWKDLAANPQTRATLAQACKTQLEAAKQSMKAYNCTF